MTKGEKENETTTKNDIFIFSTVFAVYECVQRNSFPQYAAFFAWLSTLNTST